MNVPNNRDFATEVRTDRLVVLWRVTLGGVVLAFWLLIAVAMVQRANILSWLVALGALALGSLSTQHLVRHNRFNAGVWTYSLGVLVAIGTGLASGNPDALQILPFLFPLLVFVVGLLLPPSNTFLISGLATGVMIVLPAVVTGGLTFFGPHQLAAVFLTLLSALLSSQASGELYQVTEWALLNYQKERRTSVELYENRALLERSLARSEALSDRLKETNDELERARAAAEEAKHFRGQFLANMSHELRTPLNAIIGFSETMLKFPAMYDDVTLPNAYQADLNQIQVSGRQLLTLINDILDLSKVDAGKLDIKMNVLELKPVINNVLSTAAGLLGNRPIKLETDLPAELPPVYADEARVRQVLLNLYSNAAKFTERGTITLSVRASEDEIRVSLRDTGIGIAESNLELVFEEFKQAETGMRDPRAGAGLGLAISRQLLTLMGGRIWAESEVGKGSTFHFILRPYRTAKPVVEPAAVVDKAG